MKVYPDELRAEFLRLMTEDGPTIDRRRRDYNQAIFAALDHGGYAIFTNTDLHMVMDKFDQAVRNLERMQHDRRREPGETPRINGLEVNDWFRIAVAKEQALDAAVTELNALKERLGEET